MDARADGSRRSFLAWIADVVRAGYRDGGLPGLLRRAPRFVAEDLVGERLRRSLLARPLRDRIVDRTELVQRAGAAGRLWYGDAVDPVRIDARGDDSLPDRLAAKVGTYYPERPFVAELRDARLVGPGALGFLDDELVLETASASEMYLAFALDDLYDSLAADRSRLDAYRRYRAVLAGAQSMPADADGGAPDRVDGAPGARGGPPDRLDTAVAFVPYWRNYYHWTLEFLPKVRLLERYREATGREPTVLLEPDPPRWLTETLRLAGWDPDDCVEWPGGEARVDRLVVPLHRNRFVTPPDGQFADDFTPATDEARWLAERMQSNVDDLDDDGLSRRVFLSRRDTNVRPVANEDAIETALAPLGFESYALGELPLPDQIRLFANAEVIVAPHGAGLVNMIHADDATVLELFPDDNVEPYYFCLARQLGFDYHWRVYPTESEAMVADTDDLRAAVSEILDE